MNTNVRDSYPDKFTFWRNICVSIGCGILFSIGWWIFFDAIVLYGELLKKMTIVFGPGIMSTFALIIVQSTPHKRRHISFDQCCRCPLRFLKFVLFMGFVFTFSAVIWAAYLLIVNFALAENVPVWPGIAIFLQNLFIMSANLTYKFGRKDLSNVM